jgi:acylglycerol lipase
MVGDYRDFARVLKALYPKTKLFGLGESMGGAVVMLALASNDPPPVEGFVLAAPAVWGRSTMPLLYRGALWTAPHIVPGWKPKGQSLGRMASDNIEMLRDNGRDPLFIKKPRRESKRRFCISMAKTIRSSPKSRPNRPWAR